MLNCLHDLHVGGSCVLHASTACMSPYADDDDAATLVRVGQCTGAGRWYSLQTCGNAAHRARAAGGVHLTGW
jgi:hypothetical protein